MSQNFIGNTLPDNNTLELSGGKMQIKDNSLISKRQIFTSNGNFVAPVGVSVVYLTGAGGGGGGGAGRTDTSMGGGGGGGAECCLRRAYPVVAGNTYAVVIGQGGAGGVGNSSPGSDGTATTFDGSISLAGGEANDTANLGGLGGGTDFATSTLNGSQPPSGDANGVSGQIKYGGGNGGAGIQSSGGGGGASFFGRGGTGSAYTADGGSAGICGGGGGGGRSHATYPNGFAGGNGFLIVEY
jgi:hypothetical protein